MHDLLEERGIDVSIDNLGAGDYVVGPRSLVERKHVIDLHHTVVSGRFWRQVGALRRSDDPYLLVEGVDLSGPIRPAAMRGALLAVTELGVTIVRSTDRADSAAWLASLARRRQRKPSPRFRPHYAQRPRSPSGRASHAMLCAVPTIGPDVADALLERFGSVLAVARASPAEWRSVPGVGDRRASALADALGTANPTSHSA